MKISSLIVRDIAPFVLLCATAGAQTTITLSPSHDAYVNDSAPADNFNNAFLVVGKSTQEFLPRYRSFLRFSLSSIPAGAVISSAALRLNLQAFEGSGTQAIEVHRVLATWTATTITWNVQPAYASIVEVSRSPGTSVGSWYDFPIPALVQAWVDGTYPNDGVVLKAASETTAAKTRTFASSNASNASIRPELEITYATAQDIDVAPLSLAFGSVEVGKTSPVSPPVTIKNLGGTTLQVTRIDSKDPQFQLSGVPGLPLGLPSGGSATFRAAFVPAAIGLQQGTIEVASSDPDEPVVSVGCTGTGTAPEIQVTPASLAFADQVVGTTSAAQTLRVKNEGSAALKLSSVVNSSPQFLVSGGPPLPASIAPLVEAAFEVRFRPSGAGPQTGSIAVSSDDADEPVVSVAVAGEGVHPLPTGPIDFQRGNANDSDGTIDISDVVFILSCLFLKSKCPGCEDAADANDDGLMDIGDPIFLLFHLFRSRPLPDPVECGPDPTEDSLDCEFFQHCPQTSGIIRSVVLDKADVCPGESLQVSVATEHPGGAGKPVEVSINGKKGSVQHLQFSGVPGPRWIFIAATTAEGYLDTRSITLEVRKCDPGIWIPQVHVGPNPFRPRTVDFVVANASDLAQGAERYIWDYGDGQVEETAVPYASHRYDYPSLIRDEPYTVFQAMVTVKPKDGAEVSAPKTVTVYNTYALDKGNGRIRPPAEGHEWMERIGPYLVGRYALTNLEDEPIAFTARRIVELPCDPVKELRERPSEEISFYLGSGERYEGSIVLPLASVAQDICGIAIHLTGSSRSGISAQASLYFEVQRNPFLTEPERDYDVLIALNAVTFQGLVPDADRVSDEEFYRLAGEAKIEFPVRGRFDVGGGGQEVGEECTPGQPLRDGLTCAATSEWMVVHGFIVNARKGELVLSPSCGLISAMLKALPEAQLFSHVGIMTADSIQIAHSTASEEYVKAHKIEAEIAGQRVPIGGFDPIILEFVWPGAQVQSVEDAFRGKKLRAPDGEQYTVGSFAWGPVNCEGDATIVSPRIVKPTREMEEAVRPTLDEAAEEARRMARIEGTHYRFFAYTQADLQEADACAEAPDGYCQELCDHCLATMCASFVWRSFKALGVDLVDPELADPHDGLFSYGEEERRTAAEFLHGYVLNKAYEQADDLEDILGTILEAAEKTANQVVNCFASGNCLDLFSTDWQDPGTGLTVSPDDTQRWDRVYGEAVDIVFRPAQWVRVYRVAPESGTGDISGRVLDIDGMPVEGAEVTVDVGGLSDFTDGDGRFEFAAVPGGLRQLRATKEIDGLIHECCTVGDDFGPPAPDCGLVDVQAHQTATADLVLGPPPASLRCVTIRFEGRLTDYDPESPNEHGDHDDFGSAHLAPVVAIPEGEVEPHDYGMETVSFQSSCVDDELHMKLDFEVALADENSVDVSVRVRMYEGASCGSDDKDTDRTFDLGSIAAGATSPPLEVSVENEGDGWDTAHYTITITNLQSDECSR